MKLFSKNQVYNIFRDNIVFSFMTISCNGFQINTHPLISETYVCYGFNCFYMDNFPQALRLCVTSKPKL